MTVWLQSHFYTFNFAVLISQCIEKRTDFLLHFVLDEKFSKFSMHRMVSVSSFQLFVWVCLLALECIGWLKVNFKGKFPKMNIK